MRLRWLRATGRVLDPPPPSNTPDPWPSWLAPDLERVEVAIARTEPAWRGRPEVNEVEVMHLSSMLRARGEASAFPSAEIALDGWMENALMSESATAVEDRYRDILRHGRARDAIAGRTLDGPHLTDLQVIYAPKNMPARDASTGEQKALLIGLVLAHAGLVSEMTGITPLLLLDEVVAHLDPARRAALFDELSKLGAQVWMTGADPAAFADIGPTGEIFAVEAGRIAPRP